MGVVSRASTPALVNLLITVFPTALLWGLQDQRFDDNLNNDYLLWLSPKLLTLFALTSQGPCVTTAPRAVSKKSWSMTMVTTAA